MPVVSEYLKQLGSSPSYLGADLWVTEMMVAGLDFRNPVGLEMLNCLKRVCIVERKTNKSSRSEPTSRKAPTAGVKKPVKSSHKVSQMETKNSDSETEATAHVVTGPPQKLWNPLPGLKFPCPLGNHKHEVSTCSEFFNLTPLDRWEKIEKSKMCYSCLKPKTICRGRSAILLVVSVRF